MGYTGGELAPLFDPELATSATREMAEDGRDAMMGFAVEYTPVSENPFSSPGRPPGTLKRRWRKVGPALKTLARGATGFRAEFENWDPIAPFVENDTRPHEIRPRADRAPASVLATHKPRRMGDDPQAAITFRVWPSGVRVFARVVHHPGTTGAHMTLKAATRAEAEFDRLCQPALERWAKRQVRAARRANR